MQDTVKKTLISAAVCCCFLLTGCSDSSNQEEAQPFSVYSFSGENEYFSISNGVIVLTSAEEIFYGGDLEETLETFNDITAYSVTFYVSSGGEENTLLSNSAVDKTGGTIDISGWTGQISGDILKSTDVPYLLDHLYCELETVDVNGEEHEYLLQLTVTEITGKTDS